MSILVRELIDLLEILFFAGWIGALIVVIISGIEDMETVFERDKPAETGSVAQG